MSETKHELLGRISIDANVCFGKPCIRGHRIWVSLILDMLAEGVSHHEILEDYPGLNRYEEKRRVTCLGIRPRTSSRRENLLKWSIRWYN